MMSDTCHHRLADTQLCKFRVVRQSSFRIVAAAGEKQRLNKCEIQVSLAPIPQLHKTFLMRIYRDWEGDGMVDGVSVD